jgi:hypothetical protein
MMLESTWIAQLISEGEVEQQAGGDCPEHALLNLVSDMLAQWRDDEIGLDGEFLTESGKLMTRIEQTMPDPAEGYEENCGDFSLPWKLVVRPNPDSTVYDCTPVSADHEFEDDCERV